MDVYQSELDSDKGEPALVIAADTIVVSRNGEILEKPRSETDHILMLKMLRDTDIHKVYTAVALMRPMDEAKDPGYELESCCEETTVKFDEAGKFYFQLQRGLGIVQFSPCSFLIKYPFPKC